MKIQTKDIKAGDRVKTVMRNAMAVTDVIRHDLPSLVWYEIRLGQYLTLVCSPGTELQIDEPEQPIELSQRVVVDYPSSPIRKSYDFGRRPGR